MSSRGGKSSLLCFFALHKNVNPTRGVRVHHPHDQLLSRAHTPNTITHQHVRHKPAVCYTYKQDGDFPMWAEHYFIKHWNLCQPTMWKISLPLQLLCPIVNIIEHASYVFWPCIFPQEIFPVHTNSVECKINFLKNNVYRGKINFRVFGFTQFLLTVCTFLQAFDKIWVLGWKSQWVGPLLGAGCLSVSQDLWWLVFSISQSFVFWFSSQALCSYLTFLDLSFTLLKQALMAMFVTLF